MSEDWINEISHRTLPPPPNRPWIMRMDWRNLGFFHWRVDPSVLRGCLPRSLQLDCFDGTAWVGIVPFTMANVRARCLPPIPTTSRFLELNLRTYVVHEGKPGVWFFSLDASSRLAVRGARAGFHLPYFDAEMNVSGSESICYRSRRTHKNIPPGVFDATYRAVGSKFQAQESTLEYWLTERYWLYAEDSRKRLYSGAVHHRPWPLQRAEGNIVENSIGNLIDLEFVDPPESVLFAEHIPVVAWALKREL
jgi:uncharacterized protein YqjF (DUF2071 family)